MIDFSHWFEIVLGMFMSILAWLHKELYSEHKKLRERVTEMEIRSATKGEIERLRLEIKDDIMRGFDRVHFRLDKIVERDDER